MIEIAHKIQCPFEQFLFNVASNSLCICPLYSTSNPYIEFNSQLVILCIWAINKAIAANLGSWENCLGEIKRKSNIIPKEVY